MSTTQHLHAQIQGMTCVNCQNLIKKTLDSTEGVSNASVSWKANTAEFDFDPAVTSEDAIARAIAEVGYRVVPQSEARLDLFLKTTLSIAIIAAAFVAIQRFGLLNYLVPSQLAQSTMSYGMLFVIGLITSVHCIAMCGGINLSQSLPPSSPEENAHPDGDSHPLLKSLAPSLAYNAGRVVSYTVIGFILGTIGLFIGKATGATLPESFQGALKIVAGLVMVVMGINMLGLYRGMRALTIPLPKSFSRFIGRASASNKRPFVVGLLNGLMPCGPLQSMQIIALASANPLVGAASMLLFSLGTVPLMLGLGSAVSALGTKFRAKVTTVGALLVAVLGLALLLQGVGMANLMPTNTLIALVLFAGVAGIIINIPTQMAVLKVAGAGIVALLCVFAIMQGYSTSVAQAQGDQAKLVNGVQVVNSTLQSGAYPDITVKAGVPVKWIINAPANSINGCNGTIVIADLGIQHTFTPGKNVLSFTPQKSGSIRALCWMGMIEGTINVTN